MYVNRLHQVARELNMSVDSISELCCLIGVFPKWYTPKPDDLRLPGNSLFYLDLSDAAVAQVRRAVVLQQQFGASVSVSSLAAALEIHTDDVINIWSKIDPGSVDVRITQGVVVGAIPTPVALRILGNTSLFLGDRSYGDRDFAAAATMYQRVVDIFPDRLYVIRLAKCLLESQQLERAERLCLETVSRFVLWNLKQSHVLLRLLCEALIRQEKWTAAEQYLRQLLEILAPNETTLRLSTLQSLSECMMRQGKWSNAENLPELIRDDIPDIRRMRDNQRALADCLVNQARHVEAEQILGQLNNSDFDLCLDEIQVVAASDRCDAVNQRSDSETDNTAIDYKSRKGSKREMTPFSSVALVIFDLDGTLANTASLEQSERTPARLLSPGVNTGDLTFNNRQSWGWSQEVSEVPAKLIERGYRVVVATNSPAPYASTLTHLLGVEHQGLHSHCGASGGKAVHIKRILSSNGFSPSNAIYVGDTDADAAIARNAGVHYMTAGQLLSGELLEILQTPVLGHDETPKMDLHLDSETLAELIRDSRVPFFRAESTITLEEETLFNLFSKVAQWIREPRRIRFSEGVLNKASESDNPLAAYYRTVLYYALRSHPGQPQRHEIQEVLLKNTTRDERWDYYQVVVGLNTEKFGFNPAILTRREQSCTVIRELFRTGNLRMFPPLTRETLSCVVNFHKDHILGSLLMDVKNYHYQNGSGPAVRLGLIDGIADICAGMMSSTSSVPIVPVPSSPYSANTPGQVSLRLAKAISERTVRPIIPLIELGVPATDGTKHFQLRPNATALLSAGSFYDLFDDQITNGNTVQACLQVMDAAGYRLNHRYSYSAKSFNVGGQQQMPYGVEDSGMHAKRWKHLVMRLSLPM